MRQELKDLLVHKYKTLFTKYTKNSDTDYQDGFRLSDGWFQLIDEMCNELSKLKQPIDILGMKEKFGGLRVFHTYDLDALKISSKYEEASFKICDGCGDTGSLRNIKGLMVTSCEKCLERFKNR